MLAQESKNKKIHLHCCLAGGFLCPEMSSYYHPIPYPSFRLSISPSHPPSSLPLHHSVTPALRTQTQNQRTSVSFLLAPALEYPSHPPAYRLSTMSMPDPGTMPARHRSFWGLGWANSVCSLQSSSAPSLFVSLYYPRSTLEWRALYFHCHLLSKDASL